MLLKVARFKNVIVESALIARFMGPTWGPSGADRTQVGPMLAPWTLLSGLLGLKIVESGDNKPLSEQMMVYFTDAYIWHLASVS